MSEKSTTNKEFGEVAHKFSKELKEKFPEIIGISLAGSLSWGHSDEFSDIDVDVWLPDHVYERWVINCPFMEYFKEFSVYRETPNNFSFSVGGKYKFDITILSIEKVRKEGWMVEQKANRHNSIILLDQDGQIKSLLDEKMALYKDIFENKEKFSLTNPNPKEYYFFYISAYLNYHVPVAIARKKWEQAHLNINWAKNLLIELLWTKFSRFYPYMKSRWFVIERNLGEEEKKLFKEVQLVKAHDEEDVKRRRKLLRELYQKLGYEEVTFYHERLDLS